MKGRLLRSFATLSLISVLLPIVLVGSGDARTESVGALDTLTAANVICLPLVLSEGQPIPPLWQTYTNPTYGYSVQYPARGWELEIGLPYAPGVDGIEEQVLLKGPNTAIYIEVWHNRTSLNLLEWLREMDHPVIQPATLIPAEFNSRIAGESAIYIQYPSDPLVPDRRTAVLQRGQKVFQLLHVAPGNYSGEDVQVYEHVLATFEFEGTEETTDVMPNIGKGLEIHSEQAPCKDDRVCCNNTYPENCWSVFPCCGDKPGVVEGNCTWWGIHERPDLCGVVTGHAFEWDDQAANKGFDVGPVPLEGAIAVFHAPAYGIGWHGHVAYVTGVNDDGTFDVTHMNWGDNKCNTDLPRGVFGPDGGDKVWFIYSEHGSPRPQPPSPPDGPPTLFEPPPGELFPEGTTRVRLVWGGQSDEYRCEVWHEDHKQDTDWTPNTGFWADTTLPGTYFWHVRGRSGGEDTEWSETRVFTVAGTSTPSAPTLVTPIDGDKFSYRSDVLLVWNGQSQEYYLELKGAIDAHLDWSTQTFVNTARWSTTATGTVYWRVKGRTNGLETGWSETRSFTFGADPDPSSPSLLSPADGATLPYGMDVLLQWTGQAEKYLCEVWRGDERYDTDWTSSTEHWCPFDTPGLVSWHVKGRSGDNKTPWSETRSFTINPGPEVCDPPILVEPEDSSSFNEGDQILLKWRGDCEQYKCEVWTGEESYQTDWISGTEWWSPIVTPGTVNWHVKCRCEGEETDWSQTRSYVVAAIPPCDPPQITAPPTEQDFEIPCTVELQWTGNCAEYLVEWNGNPLGTANSDWIGQTSYALKVPAGTVAGKGYWHVKGRNSQGVETNWSETWNFDLKSTPLRCNVPVLGSPVDAVTFRWDDQIDLRWDGNCEEYWCEVSWDGGGCKSDWTRQKVFRACMPPKYQGGTVTWKVKGRNSAQVETGWSSSRSYTVPPAPPPCEIPQLQAPPTEQDFTVPCTVELRWTGNCAEYYVAWWGNQVNGTRWWNSKTSHPIVVSTQTGKVYWHVKGRTAAGVETDWSETRNFDLVPVVVPPCSVPTLASPPNGATFNCGVSVDLQWSGNCEEYRCLVWWEGGSGDSGWTRNTVYRSPLPPCTEGDTTVYWKVKGRNSAQVETGWSETRRFIIKYYPPCDTPQLQNPPTEQDFQVPSTVNLQWTGNCAEYYVEWARNPSYSPVGGHSAWVTQKNYVRDFPQGTTPGKIYWHVKGRTAQGIQTDWSETRNFDVAGCDPCSTPTLVGPQDGASLVCGATVDLQWSGNCEEYYCDVTWSGGGGNSGWTRGTVFRSPMPPKYEGGTVSWKVKGRNTCEEETSWSPTRSFSVQACPTPVVPPLPPVPWDPPKGSHFSGGTQVALRWNASSGASLYALEVWSDCGYYWTQRDINNVEYPTPPLNDSCKYQWHGAAKSAKSDYSPWGETWYFYID